MDTDIDFTLKTLNLAGVLRVVLNIALTNY
jgi:hypothetical protein